MNDRVRNQLLHIFSGQLSGCVQHCCNTPSLLHSPAACLPCQQPQLCKHSKQSRFGDNDDDDDDDAVWLLLSLQLDDPHQLCCQLCRLLKAPAVQQLHLSQQPAPVHPASCVTYNDRVHGCPACNNCSTQVTASSTCTMAAAVPADGLHCNAATMLVVANSLEPCCHSCKQPRNPPGVR